MKIATSTGDFSYYVETVPEKVSLFGDTKFKYINLEQTGSTPFFFSENDEDTKRFADECAEAAAKAGDQDAVRTLVKGSYSQSQSVPGVCAYITGLNAEKIAHAANDQAEQTYSDSLCIFFKQMSTK